jgi:peptidoglycan/xylan/chitin deacetylase (PgdA/CDA1 family)
MNLAPWPQGKQIAVTISVMLETWSPGKGPSYGTHMTPVKAGTVDHGGIAWAAYGGNVGVWRLLRVLEENNCKATFAVNTKCLEVFPKATETIAAKGHVLAGHAYTQDQMMIYLSRDEQLQCIQQATEVFQRRLGRRPTGWMSPVIAYNTETLELRAGERYDFSLDMRDYDLPRVVDTPLGKIVNIANCDFTDTRVLRASSLDFFEVYKETLDFLIDQEPHHHLGIALHCHVGGRPMMAAMLDKILKYYSQRGVWFTTHTELAQWARDNNVAEETNYERRFGMA